MKVNNFVLKLWLSLDGGFIRVFGYGVSWRDLRKIPPLFSERNGYKKHINIGNWSFSFVS
jgi:hypothetical protein